MQGFANQLCSLFSLSLTYVKMKGELMELKSFLEFSWFLFDITLVLFGLGYYLSCCHVNNLTNAEIPYKRTGCLVCQSFGHC